MNHSDLNDPISDAQQKPAMEMATPQRQVVPIAIHLLATDPAHRYWYIDRQQKRHDLTTIYRHINGAGLFYCYAAASAEWLTIHRTDLQSTDPRLPILLNP